MSNSAFCKRLLEATGKSPGQYRADEIVLRACAPLLQTNDTLATIPADLGRHDAFHLSRRLDMIVECPWKDFRWQQVSF